MTFVGKQEEAVVPSIRVYDTDGNLVEFYVYAVNPQTLRVVLSREQVMTYDENRLLTQVVDTTEGRKETILFTFDERLHKKLTNRQFSGTFDLGEYGTKTYDREGNMTEWLIKGQRNVYTYDRSGRMIMRSVFDGRQLVPQDRYSYEDDDRGNWIAKHWETFLPENGWTPVDNVIYREISYFK